MATLRFSFTANIKPLLCFATALLIACGGDDGDGGGGGNQAGDDGGNGASGMGAGGGAGRGSAGGGGGFDGGVGDGGTDAGGQADAATDAGGQADAATDAGGQADAATDAGADGDAATDAGNHDGGPDSSMTADPTYAVGGTVNGLLGSGLVLRLNGGADLPISGDGPFTFTHTLEDGAEYSVTVHAQPTGPDQTCSVDAGDGEIDGDDVTGVLVTCVTPPPQYTIGGSVQGLEDSTGLVLHRDGEDLPIATDGTFVFTQPVDDGAEYDVSVATQPSDPLLDCSVMNGAGTVSGAAVTDIAVRCEGWREATLIEELTGNASTPHVAFDGDGDAIAVWTQLRSGTVQVLSSRYDGETGTWSMPERRDSQNYDAANPRIAIDPSGNALAIWQQQDAGGVYSIWASRYTSATESWAAAAALESRVGEAAFPQVAFDPNGHALVVWSQRVDATFQARYDVWARRYVAGTGWDDPELIESNDAGGAIYPKIAFDAGGNAFATWHHAAGARFDIWANRYAAGTGWDTAAPIETDDAGSALYPELAVTSDGIAFVVWQQHDGTRYGIVANRYSAGSWGTAQPIDDTDDAATFPDVAVDAAGNALVVWRQATAGNAASVWAARFDADSTSWQAAEPLATGGIDGGVKDLELAFDADGNAIAIYQRYSGSIYDVFASRYAVGTGWLGSRPVEVGALSATGVQIAFGAGGRNLAVWTQIDGSGYRNVFFNVYR